MCGIFCYLGSKKASSMVLEGLKKLEYRGYDSSGVASICNGELVFCKQVGKVEKLCEKMSCNDWKSTMAIAHTRWATHGAPTEDNAHPQLDQNLQCAVVHNGIIENENHIRKLLKKRGIVFKSDTDTEVLAQLIGCLYKGNLLISVHKAVSLLKGSFAIAVIHKNHPEEIVCVAKDSPLIVGVGSEEIFISSDSRAFAKYTTTAIRIANSELALLHKDLIYTYDKFLRPINKNKSVVSDVDAITGKGHWQHYMLKEIFEQPGKISQLLNKYVSYEGKKYCLKENFLKTTFLGKYDFIKIIACGSSYHAGLLASYILELYGDIGISVETSSEFLYRSSYIRSSTLAILISQSGETADTLSVLRKLRRGNLCFILGVCNVEQSSLSCEVDECLFIEAGLEMGVASTKAFTNQLLALLLLGVKLGKARGFINSDKEHEILQELVFLPEKVEDVLKQKNFLHGIAKKYSLFEDFFFLGRRLMFPVALEGALKLKEIAYVNANGYPAGEMKHGPIALISPKIPTVAICSDTVIFSKMINNIREVKAREGKILAIIDEAMELPLDIVDDIIKIPCSTETSTPFLAVIVCQLLAYYIALEKGTDIDCPKNLAKSVTVE